MTEVPIHILHADCRADAEYLRDEIRRILRAAEP